MCTWFRFRGGADHTDFISALRSYMLWTIPFVAFVVLSALIQDSDVDLDSSIPFYFLLLIFAGIPTRMCAAVYRGREDEFQDTGKKAFAAFISCLFVLVSVFIVVVASADTLYAIRFVPLYLVMVIIPLVICGSALAQLCNSSDGEHKGGAVFLGCCNCFFTILCISGVVFIILKLDDVVDWPWIEVLIPVWIMNSIYWCIDVPIIIYFTVMLLKSAPVQFKGRVTALVLLMNFTVIPIQLFEILLCIPDLSALAKVSPILVAWGSLLGVACIDGIVDSFICCRRRYDERCQRIELQKRVETERAAHCIRRDVVPTASSALLSPRPPAPFAPSLSVGAAVAAATTAASGADYGASPESKTASDAEPNGREGDLMGRFEGLLRALRSARTSSEATKSLTTVCRLISSSRALRNQDTRRRLIQTAQEKKTQRPSIWTQEVANQFGKTLQQISSVMSFLSTMSELSLTNVHN